MKHLSPLRPLIVLATVALLSATSFVNAAADWPNFHRDAGHTGFDGQNVVFNGASKDWTSAGLDGAVYAQPLVVGNRVFVATENNSVYAFDAASGATVWHYNAGAPESGGNFNCGNIDPNGITGTPVIDTTAGRLYAVATIDVSNTPRYELITLDINTGNAIGSPITLSYTGFDTKTQGQRGALGFLNNMVYVPFGGRDGDCPPYDGVVFGVPTGGGSLIHYTTPSRGTGAGMWSTGGVTNDGTNLFVSTGNADVGGCTPTYVYDDSVLKLSPTLQKLDQFAPSDWSSLSCSDADLGSTAPLLLGNGLVFIQGKESIAYLLNQNALGSTFSGSTFNAGGQAFAGPGCNGMVFGAAAYRAPYVYVPCDSGGLLALNVNAGAKTFSKAWQASNGKSGPPIIAGGAVWDIDSSGTLNAFDPATGRVLFTDSPGSFSTSFPTLAAGDGRLFVATDSNVVSYLLNPVCTTGTTPTGTGGSGSTTFYFAEGFTAPGFNECLALLMPNTSGTATIDYWTQSSHTLGTVAMTAGQVATVNVNAVVGANQEVSVKVTLPGPGIAERLLNFTYGSWHGSTDIVGVTAPNTEWDFAEGSTLNVFSEYLTLQNPNNSTVPAALNYMTDSGAHPVKTVNLPANSRTTVEVFSGNTVNNVNPCTPQGAGANCGVGRGIGGVSVKVTTPTPIVAERPFYVNNFSFGYGPINDGHVAFGANAPATNWNFAEGTTLAGFNEYLTIQNPNPTTAANVTLRYIDENAGVTTHNIVVNPLTRFTVEVFKPTYGVGVGAGGISAQVTSTNGVGIVAERPMYIYHDFGSGVVGGATDVLGATGLGTLFGFSAASSTTGNFPYLTLQNPGASTANVTIDYYTGTGKVTKALTVNHNTRVTVQAFQAGTGIGPGELIFGIVVTSTNAVPILVEKPTYSTVPNAYGATDTMGYTPPGGTF